MPYGALSSHIRSEGLCSPDLYASAKLHHLFCPYKYPTEKVCVWAHDNLWAIIWQFVYFFYMNSRKLSINLSFIHKIW